MKRLLIALTLVLLSTPLVAESDRSVLLTADGTLFTVDTVSDDAGNVPSSRYLVLTTQNARGTTKAAVPATLTGGHNWSPELAYDDESQTLFVLWLRSRNSFVGSNEVAFCSYQDGRWNQASAVEDIPYRLRYNLRVGVTRKIEATDGEGQVRVVPGLSVHVAWWDESGSSASARYAMLTVEKGNVIAVFVRPLEDMIERANAKTFPYSEDGRNLMKYPSLFESPNRDTIDVLFGDTLTNTMHRITLKPVLQYRVRIPVGIRDTGYPLPGTGLTVEANAVVNTLPTGADRLVFYANERGSLRYLIYQDGKWSAKAQSIALTDVAVSEALAALRKMVNGD